MIFRVVLLYFCHEFLFVEFVAVVGLQDLIDFHDALAFYFAQLGCFFSFFFYLQFFLPTVCNLFLLNLIGKRSLIDLFGEGLPNLSFGHSKRLIFTHRQKIMDEGR